jgi:hypothetical protein
MKTMRIRLKERFARIKNQKTIPKVLEELTCLTKIRLTDFLFIGIFRAGTTSHS